MEIKIKIYLTNWINVLGTFIAVYLFFVIREVIERSSTGEAGLIIIILFGLLFSLIAYGLAFWIIFMVIMFVLDMTLMNEKTTFLKIKLFIEWAIASSPLLYWFMEYTQWAFMIAVIAFAFTQFFRGKKITAILESVKSQNQ